MASTVTVDGAWTLQSLDTAAVGRLHDFAMLQAVTTTPNAQARAGVIPSVGTSGSPYPVDLIVVQTATASMGVIVGPGNAVLANSSARGPYVFMNSQNRTLTVATANATNPRIDLVYAQVIDNPPDTGTTTMQVGIVTGTPAASPVVPALPTNGVCIPLAQVLVGANVTQIVNANITDVRKSAAVGRGPRLMLPGDALSDPGFCYGELRQRRHSGYQISGSDAIVTDYWGFDSTWHGMRDLPLPGSSVVAAGPVTSSGWPVAEAVFWTLSIPDPGWAYYVDLDAFAYRLNVSGGDYGQFKCRLNNATGTLFRQSDAISASTFSAGVNLRASIWNGSSGTPFTGAITLVVTGLANSVNNNVVTSPWCSAIIKPA